MCLDGIIYERKIDGNSCPMAEPCDNAVRQNQSFEEKPAKTLLRG